MVRARASGAGACLAGIALALVGVPGLHALVHLHEALQRGHGHRDHEHGDHEHGHHARVHLERADDAHRDHEAGRRADRAHHHHDHEPAPRHHHHGGRHHHDGESPLEHGRGAPEHLGLALLESEPPPIPLAGHPVDSALPPAPIDRIAAAQGYVLLDLVASHRVDRYELGLAVTNLLDSEWREAQLAEASRVSPAAELREDVHFTPGAPLTALATLGASF